MIFSFLQVKTEPPVELNVDITSLPSLPDPSILPNNPLIPKAFFGFENMNTFEPLKAPTPMPKPQPTPKPNKPEKSEPIVEKVKAVKVESHTHEEPLFQPPVKSIPDKKSSNTDKGNEVFILSKGQIISKYLFGVFNFFQKTNENTSFMATRGR